MGPSKANLLHLTWRGLCGMCPSSSLRDGMLRSPVCWIMAVGEEILEPLHLSPNPRKSWIHGFSSPASFCPCWSGCLKCPPPSQWAIPQGPVVMALLALFLLLDSEPLEG